MSLTSLNVLLQRSLFWPQTVRGRCSRRSEGLRVASFAWLVNDVEFLMPPKIARISARKPIGCDDEYLLLVRLILNVSIVSPHFSNTLLARHGEARN